MPRRASRGACSTRRFPADGGRWELRRSSFRQGGVPMRLLVLTDLRQALREEERQAWQRLVRVLSHEINNSLAPIQSIAGTLRALLGRAPRPADADEDLERGLGVIGGRAESLSRFMRSYARMARLPAPALAPVDVGAWVDRVAQLEKRLPVRVRPGPPITLSADGDQLEQLLINLVSNAVDASTETGGGVEIAWDRQQGALDLRVVDEGRDCPRRRTCSPRSSPRSGPAPGSASCCRARSPRRTAGRSRSRTATTRAAAWRGCGSRCSREASAVDACNRNGANDCPILGRTIPIANARKRTPAVAASLNRWRIAT